MGVHSAGMAGQGNSRTAFMRPLSVAWGLITPNVPKFVVRPGSSTVSTASKPSSGTTPTSTQATGPSGSTSWPPSPTTGQTWRIAMKGDNIDEIWQLKLTGKNSKGIPQGTVTNGKNKSEALFYYLAKEDTLIFALPGNKEEDFYSCIVDRSGAKNAVWTGELAYFANPDAKPQLLGACGVTAGTGSVTATTASKPTQTPAGSGGSGKTLTWPLHPQVGQNWQFNVGKFGAATVNLTGKDKDGLPSGEGVLGGKIKIDALFYYEADKATTWLDLFDGESLLYCSFTKDSLKGNTLTGRAYYREDASSNEDAQEVGTCTGQLK